MHDAAFTISVILRRLNQPDGRIREQRHEILEPVLMHDIVSIDDTDHLSVGSRVDKGETQRSRLEAGEIVGANEFEAFAERAAMLLNWQPKRRIQRVVDHHNALVVLVVEQGDRIERLREHLGRLVMCRYMNLNLGRRGFGGERRTFNETKRLSSKRDRCDLLNACERDYNQWDEQQDAET